MEPIVTFSPRVVRALRLAMITSAATVILSLLHQFGWHPDVTSRAAGATGLVTVGLMIIAYRWTTPRPRTQASGSVGGVLAMSVIALFDTRTISGAMLLTVFALGCAVAAGLAAHRGAAPASKSAGLDPQDTPGSGSAGN